MEFLDLVQNKIHSIEAVETVYLYCPDTSVQQLSSIPNLLLPSLASVAKQATLSRRHLRNVRNTGTNMYLNCGLLSVELQTYSSR